MESSHTDATAATTATMMEVHLTYRGKVQSVRVPRATATGATLMAAARQALFPTVSPADDDEMNGDGTTDIPHLKLLWKGKRLADDDDAAVLFGTDYAAADSKTTTTSKKKKPPKIMVLETRAADVAELNARKSDPTIRGFDNEKQQQRVSTPLSHWGPDHGRQNKEYKFCKLVACSWQSFGHRPHDTDTPHDFAARRLLERLATDPGVVAVLVERQLVVGTLGEMDPIDDRLMQQKQQQGGGCLLGYNTNGGARIDIKLRNDNLKGFRPYPDLVATLLHELSHNWVGEHNLLFWTNYGQMRVEYLFTHTITLQGLLVNGQTMTQLAGLPSLTSLRDVYNFVMAELAHEMRQHGLTPDSIGSAIQSRCDELVAKTDLKKNTLGGGNTSSNSSSGTVDVREMARQAAERRRAEEDKKHDKTGNS